MSNLNTAPSALSIWRLILFHTHLQSLDDGLKNEPDLSFYGVYDGHAGKDAAAFAASHLHGRILDSPYFPSDPVLAIKEAFNKTDQVFLEKGQKEVSTNCAIITFIRVPASSVVFYCP